MQWLIAYDIEANNRRGRVARRLERAGLRVQKSVFLVEMPPRQTVRLLEELGRMIDGRSDRVAAWPLQENWQNTTVEVGAPTSPLPQQSVIW